MKWGTGHIVNVYKFSGRHFNFWFNYFTSNHLTQRKDCQRKWAHIISSSIALPSPEHTILALEKICQSFLDICVLFYWLRPVKGVHPVGERFQCFFFCQKSIAIFMYGFISKNKLWYRHKHNLDFDLAPLYKPMNILKKNPFHCFILTDN